MALLADDDVVMHHDEMPEICGFAGDIGFQGNTGGNDRTRKHRFLGRLTGLGVLWGTAWEGKGLQRA
jgi:hypothetical protein